MKRLVLLAILILGLIGTQIQATDIIKPRVLVSTDIGGCLLYTSPSPRD